MGSRIRDEGAMRTGQMSARALTMRADQLLMAARVLLAALGGYAVSALACALLAVILPGSRAEAVSAALIASFAIMAAAVIGVFAARTIGRAALVLMLVVALLTAALWIAGAFQTGAAA